MANIDPTDLGLVIMAGLLLLPAVLIARAVISGSSAKESPYPVHNADAAHTEPYGAIDLLSINQIDIHKRSFMQQLSDKLNH